MARIGETVAAHVDRSSFSVITFPPTPPRVLPLLWQITVEAPFSFPPAPLLFPNTPFHSGTPPPPFALALLFNPPLPTRPALLSRQSFFEPTNFPRNLADAERCYSEFSSKPAQPIVKRSSSSSSRSSGFPRGREEDAVETLFSRSDDGVSKVTPAYLF